MKKRIIAVFLFIYVFLFSINIYAFENPVFYIKDSTKYENKDEVTVELCVENASRDIASWSLDFKYDSTKLEYLSSKAGKDLHASFKLAENVPEESRVAIGAISFIGFGKDGVYYSVTFKVKDDSENIPIELNVREVCDENGNTVKHDSKSGKIIVTSEKDITVSKENVEIKKEIERFEKTEIDQLETLEEIIIDNGNVEILSSDEITYENDNIEVIEILDDGTMIPNKDGITNVRVKVNDNSAGMLEVEVKDGKIKKITSIEEKGDFVAIATTNEIENNSLSENDYNINTKDKIDDNKKSNNIFIIVMVVVITILFIIFLLIKKKRGGKK